jgi:acyl-CoA thioesterase FadM
VTPRVHVQELEVPFGDIDQAQVLYFPNLLHYCHLVMEGFFAGPVGIPYPRFLRERGLGLPTVHLETDYRATIPYGMRLRAELTVLRIGRTSAVFRFRFLDALDSALKAESRNTVVCVRLAAFASEPWPEDLRTTLEAYLEGVASEASAKDRAARK